MKYHKFSSDDIKNLHRDITDVINYVKDITNRRYLDVKSATIEYVITEDHKGYLRFIPFIESLNENTKEGLYLELKHQLDSTNLMVGDDKIFRHICYHRSSDFAVKMFDPNYTRAIFRLNNKFQDETCSLSIFDEDTDNYLETQDPAPYVKMACYHHNITPEEFFNNRAECSLNDFVDPYDLPDEYRYDWYNFSKLYYEVFKSPANHGYEFICSSGIKEIEIYTGEEDNDDTVNERKE